MSPLTVLLLIGCVGAQPMMEDLWAGTAHFDFISKARFPTTPGSQGYSTYVWGIVSIICVPLFCLEGQPQPQTACAACGLKLRAKEAGEGGDGAPECGGLALYRHGTFMGVHWLC